MEPIRSPRNPRVAAAGRLRRVRERRKANATLVEGPHVLADAIAGGITVREVFVLEDDAAGLALAGRSGGSVVVVSAEVLERLAPTEHPRGPVAVIEVPSTVDGTGDVVWIDVSDPGNAGTVIRTAAAFGFSVAAPAGSVDLWAPKVMRAGAGGHFRTPIRQPVELDSIEAVRIVTVVDGGDPPARLREISRQTPCAVVIGSEAHGVGPEVVAGADLKITIPMPGGTESLNASVAGAIVMYELAGRELRSGDSSNAD